MGIGDWGLGIGDWIYKEINYGKPIRFYNQTWLTYDAPLEADIYGPRVMIPPGWRIPTLKDYKNLFKFIGNNEKIKIFLTHERLINMKKDFLYITSDKVFPDDYNGYNTKAWAYFCIGFNFYDEVEYPGIEPLVLPNQQKKIINIAQDNKKDEENINTMNNNNNSKEEIKEEFEDASAIWLKSRPFFSRALQNSLFLTMTSLTSLPKHLRRKPLVASAFKPAMSLT